MSYTESELNARRVIRAERQRRFTELYKKGGGRGKVDAKALCRRIEKELPFAPAKTASVPRVTAGPKLSPTPTPAPKVSATPAPAPAKSSVPDGAIAKKVDYRPPVELEWVNGQRKLTAASAKIVRERAAKSFEQSQITRSDENRIRMKLHGDSYIAGESISLYRLGAGSPEQCWTIACENEDEMLATMEPGPLKVWRQQRLAQTKRHLGLSAESKAPAPAATTTKPTKQLTGLARTAAAWNQKYSK